MHGFLSFFLHFYCSSQQINKNTAALRILNQILEFVNFMISLQNDYKHKKTRTREHKNSILTQILFSLNIMKHKFKCKYNIYLYNCKYKYKYKYTDINILK